MIWLGQIQMIQCLRLFTMFFTFKVLFITEKLEKKFELFYFDVLLQHGTLENFISCRLLFGVLVHSNIMHFCIRIGDQYYQDICLLIYF